MRRKEVQIKMKFKQLLALLLCISLLMLTVTACRNSDDDDDSYQNGNGSEGTPPVNTPDLTDNDDLALQEAREILQLLQENLDSPDFIGLFFYLMEEFTEDPGVEQFPYGYLFKEGEMMDEFYNATRSLEIGGLSDIVETDYGYHIILRLPIDLDGILLEPLDYGIVRTLREDVFERMLFEWRNSLNIEFSPEYTSIDIPTLFSPDSSLNEAFNTFAPDTVMMSSGDIVITWDWLYGFIYRQIQSMLMAVYDFVIMPDTDLSDFPVIDWHEEFPDGNTVEVLILLYATNDATNYMSYKYGVNLNNITLDDDTIHMFDAYIEDLIITVETDEEYDIYEDFAAFLRHNFGIYDVEVFKTLSYIDLLIGSYYDEFPDENIIDFAESEGFLMAAHILRVKPGF